MIIFPCYSAAHDDLTVHSENLQSECKNYSCMRKSDFRPAAVNKPTARKKMATAADSDAYIDLF